MRIRRELKICLWQNMLNVVSGTIKYVQKFPRVFLWKKVSSGNVWDVRTQYSDWKRKRDFVFLQLKLVWPNDEVANCVYQFLSFFFPNMNLWPDFRHFIFISLKSTSLLQILKLVMGNVRTLYIAFLNIFEGVSLYL